MYKTWTLLSLLISLFCFSSNVRHGQDDVRSLLVQGMEAKERGNYALAKEVWTLGLSEAISKKDKEYIARFTYWLGYVNEMTGQYNVARKYYTDLRASF